MSRGFTLNPFAALGRHVRWKIIVPFVGLSLLVSLAGTFSGREAIVGFYRDLAFGVDDLSPSPGVFIVDGDRVAVEIELRMGGTTTLVADVFTLSGGRIARVAIYSGPPVTDSNTA